MAPNEFACAEVHYTPGTEYRFLVSGAEWIEFSKQADELRGYLGKCQHRIDFLLWLELSGKYVVGHEFLKSASKFRDILFFSGTALPRRCGLRSFSANRDMSRWRCICQTPEPNVTSL